MFISNSGSLAAVPVPVTGPTYQIGGSLRLRASANASISRIPSADDTHPLKKTYSIWVKRGTLNDTYLPLITNWASANDWGVLRFGYNIGGSHTDKLVYLTGVGGNVSTQCVSSADFRDPTGWYHIVLALDNTVATGRTKLWVNGLEITDWYTHNEGLATAGQGEGLARQHVPGQLWTSEVGYMPWMPHYFDGYIAEFYCIDGKVLDASSFGQVDPTWGAWTAKPYGSGSLVDGRGDVLMALNFDADFTDQTTLYGNTTAATAHGTTTVLSSAQSVFGGSSAYFDGSGSGWLFDNGPTTTNLSTNNFTLHFWIYPTVETGSGPIRRYVSMESSLNALVVREEGGVIKAFLRLNSGALYNMVSTVAPQVNTWTHIAVVRSGNLFVLYINGNAAASMTNTGGLDLTGVGAAIGNSSSGGYESFTGYIDEVVFLQNTALWTYNFTPPSAEYPGSGLALWDAFPTSYPADLYWTNVTFLQDGNTDVSGHTQIHTAVGTGAGQSASATALLFNVPLNNQYAATDVGAFYCPSYTACTIEFWVYPSNVTQQFWAGVDGINYLSFSAGSMSVNWNGAGGAWQATGLTFNVWQHVVLQRDVGGNSQGYINGVLVNSATGNVGVVGSSSAPLVLGSYATNDNRGFVGGLTQFRFTVGVERYPGPFTVHISADPYYSNVVLLLHGNGNDGSVAVVDSANAPKTVTAHGSATLSTAQAKYGSSSMHFTGSSSDYLEIPYSPDFSFGTGDFTIEAWFYCPTGATYVNNQVSLICAGRQYTGPSGGGWDFHAYDVPGVFQVRLEYCHLNATTTQEVVWIPGTGGITRDTWHHISACRKAGTTSFFINGRWAGDSQVFNGLAFDVPNNGSLLIGAGSGIVGVPTPVTWPMHGYIDDVRITKGVSRYTGQVFTPPTEAFVYTPTYVSNDAFPFTQFPDSAPADPHFSQVTLLLHGNVDYTDSSYLANEVTVYNGSVIDSTVMKFGVGSMYFNGTSASLTVPNSAAFTFDNADFTLELWVNPTAYGSPASVLLSNWSNLAGWAWEVRLTDVGLVQFSANGNAYNAYGQTVPLNTWTHIAVCRSSGELIVYTNGLPGIANSNIGQVALTVNTGATISIGKVDTPAVWFYSGYMDDIRITKGLARYTGQFYPAGNSKYGVNGSYLPFSDKADAWRLCADHSAGTPFPWPSPPPGPWADGVTGDVAVLHFNGSNGSTSLIDTGPNGLACNFTGSAYLSNIRAAYGISAAYFPGVPGSGAFVTAGAPYQPTTQPFTVEAWVYFATSSTNQTILQWNADIGVSGMLMYYDGTQVIALCADTSGGWTVTLTAPIESGTWHHIAFQRDANNVFTIFRDGESLGQTVWSGSIYYAGASGMTLGIGANNNNWPMNGSIDEFRITFGRARYQPQNNWSPSNVSVSSTGNGPDFAMMYDATNDVPLGSGGAGLGNYPVLNPLFVRPSGSNIVSNTSFTDGNLRCIFNDFAPHNTCNATMSVPVDFNIYFEYSVISLGTGVARFTWIRVGSCYYRADGVADSQESTIGNFSGFNAGPMSAGDTIGVAFGPLGIAFYKNNQLRFSGPITTPTAPSVIELNGYDSTEVVLNFGQQPFIYLPPPGYSALHTGSTDTPSIVRPDRFFGVTQYAAYANNTYPVPAVQLPDSVGAGDPFANYNTLLLHFNGADGSTDFLDSSASPKVGTANNSAQTSTAQSKFGASSLHLNGLDSFVEYDPSSDWDCGVGNETNGAGDFTIEAWVFPTALGVHDRPIFNLRSSSVTPMCFGISVNSQLYVWGSAAHDYLAIATPTVPLNQWSHVAAIKQGFGIGLYMNGVCVGYGGTNSAMGDSVTAVQIGASAPDSQYFAGYIEDLRLTRHMARANVTNSVENSGGFTPDLVWIKTLSEGSDHKWTDTTRGATRALSCNLAAPQAVNVHGLLSMDASGFTVGTNADYNKCWVNSRQTHIAWQWKKGSAPGLDIVTHVGNGGLQQVPHNLGVVPALVITKATDSVSNWVVHSSASFQSYGSLYLNLGGYQGVYGTHPEFNTSSYITLGAEDSNQLGVHYVSYVFAEVKDYSAFGSKLWEWLPGTFVDLGFSPKFVIMKVYTRTDVAGFQNDDQWYIFDTQQSRHNVVGVALHSDSSQPQTPSSLALDFTANGFLVRPSGVYSSQVYDFVYFAFAETPFKYSLAR